MRKRQNVADNIHIICKLVMFWYMYVTTIEPHKGAILELKDQHENQIKTKCYPISFVHQVLHNFN